MGAATKQQALEKLHGMVNKIGYPDKWRDYSSVAIERGDFLGNVDRATEFESRRAVGQDRQAGGPRRVADDAAHRERLLRPADERHQLSRRACCSRRCSIRRWTTRRITATPAPPSGTN